MRNNMQPMQKIDMKKSLGRTAAYMRSSLPLMIFALALAALSAVMTIIGPDKIGQIATIISDGLLGGIDLAAIAKIGITMAVIYLLSAPLRSVF